MTTRRLGWLNVIGWFVALGANIYFGSRSLPANLINAGVFIGCYLWLVCRAIGTITVDLTGEGIASSVDLTRTQQAARRAWLAAERNRDKFEATKEQVRANA